VAKLTSREPTLGSSRLLAIDGPAGSGKTTVAERTARLLLANGQTCRVLSLDDLYDGWDGLNPSLSARVIEQVLRPLANGGPARWQQYDWAAGSFGRWRTFAAPSTLVLEGCGAGAVALAPYTTLLAWVEVAEPLRTRRVVERDGPDVLAQLPGWRDSERRHFAANRTPQRADLRVTP